MNAYKSRFSSYFLALLLAGGSASIGLAHNAEAAPITIPNTCPTAEQSTWMYQLDKHEQTLADVDLEGAGTTFSLLADHHGTSIIIRVKDAETGRSIGVIKTNTSNTLPEGEIYAYRLARLLGFSDIIAPVIPVDLHGGALTKVRDLLRQKTYKDANKENSRRYVVNQIERAIRNDDTFHGAFKVWVPAFIFHAGLGKPESIGNQPIAKYFKANAPQPPSEDLRMTQTTRLYSPEGTYEGVANLRELTIDYSNMMLMDALMGQNDRFAGANVHIQSVAGERKENGKRGGKNVYDLGRVRLLSLDNGASLHSKNGAGLLDLQGKRFKATRMERFSRASVDQLRRLSKRLYGDNCEQKPSQTEIESIFAFLGVHDKTARERALGYIPDVIAYIDALEAKYGDSIYFDETEK